MFADILSTLSTWKFLHILDKACRLRGRLMQVLHCLDPLSPAESARRLWLNTCNPGTDYLGVFTTGVNLKGGCLNEVY
jgi:hypothetical protein